MNTHSPYREAIVAIQQAQKVLVLSPGNVDGDCLGANVVFHDVLQKQGKITEHVCFRTLPEKYHFYPFVDRVLERPTRKDFDLVIVTDTAEKHLLGLPEEFSFLADGSIPLVNIDHHVSNSNWGTINVVEHACSASYMTFELLLEMGVQMTSSYATALLAGIYFDTGGLMHNNTTADVFAAASKLFAYDPDLPAITNAFFKKTSVPKLRLWGRVFDKAQLTEDGVLMAAVTPKDFETCQANKDDLDGAVEFLNYVPEKKFSFLMYDTGEGKVKGSFRTQDPQVDVNAVAQQFGGGGHKMAAGFMVPGAIEEQVRWKIRK